MPLESLQPDARTDVRRAAVEAVDKKIEIVFDIRKEKIIKTFIYEILETKKNEDWNNFLSKARNFIILFPERKKDIGLDDELWEKLKKYFESANIPDEVDDGKWNDGDYAEDCFGKATPYIKKAADLKILFPDLFSKLDFKEKFALKMLTILMEINDEEDYHSVFEMRMLFPIELDEIEEKDHIYNNKIKTLKWNQEICEEYAGELAQVRMAFPEKFENDLISKKDWEDLKKLLKDNERTKKEYHNLIVWLQILAAEKILISDKGIKLIFPREKEGHEEKVRPLPIIKE